MNKLKKSKLFNSPIRKSLISSGAGKAIALIFSVLAMVFLISVIAQAWNEPTCDPSVVDPSTCNVSPPINEGPGFQEKVGNLALPNLYLNATGAEGNIYEVDWIVGNNNLYLKGNLDENAPVYIYGSELGFYYGGVEKWRIDSAGVLQVGSVPWARLSDFPSDCASGQYVYGIDGTTNAFKCSAPEDGGEEGYWSLTGWNLYPNDAGYNIGLGTEDPGSYKLKVYGEDYGIYGRGAEGGIFGVSDLKSGVYGMTGGTGIYAGVYGYNVSTGPGVYGYSTNGIGVRGFSQNGWAGYFYGDVYARGDVGIGTTAPTVKLDVDGYVKGRTGLCIGDDCRGEWPAGGGSGSGITGVYGGDGLIGQGTSGNITLHVGPGTGISVGADSVNIKNNAFSCSASNQALKSINIDTGVVTCETDDIGGGGGIACNDCDSRFVNEWEAWNSDLQVVGGVISRLGRASGSDLGLYSDGIGNWLRLVSSSGDIRFYTDGAASNNYYGGTPAMKIDSNGKIGIGTDGPGAKLEIYQSSSPTSNHTLRIQDSDSDWMSFLPRLSTANFNPLVKSGDKAIIYSDGSIDTGSIVIGQWSNSPRGIRISSLGELFVRYPASPEYFVALYIGGSIDVHGSDFKLGTNDNRYKGLKTGQRAFVHSEGGDGLVINYNGDFEGGVKIESNLLVGPEAGGQPHRLQLPNISGNAGWGIANDWKTYSSERWKENIEPIPDALGKIENLRGVYFDWKKEYGGKHDIGFIAEEVGTIVPEAVDWEENGIYANGLSYNKITALLVEGIKELDAKVEQSLVVFAELIEDKALKLKELIAEKIFTDEITVKRIRMIDEATGEIYCVRIENGDWRKEKGECR